MTVTIPGYMLHSAVQQGNLNIHRRSFLKIGATTAALAGLGDLRFLAKLPSVSAAEAALPPKVVRFHPEVEPLVRLLEDTPRERILEEVAARIKRGLTYREVVASLLLAGIRNIQPRPVGFKFHAVLVVNSAHLAALASPESDRWLPIFWAIDQFKRSQATDLQEGDWALGPVDESAVPPSHKARQAFTDAMDRWDESGADAAMASLARTASAHEIFEILCRYGVRDFRDIGHKAIYVANSFRTLEVVGWHHAEPVLRSLAYALLDKSRDTVNPSTADLPADRPFRQNLELVKTFPHGWLNGKPSQGAVRDMLQTIREGSPKDTSEKTIDLLNRGLGPDSIFDAFFNAAGEMLMRAPGILALHAATFTNAVHYAWQHCHDNGTRQLLLLQNAAYLPLFRSDRPARATKIDELEPSRLQQTGPAALEEIFGEASKDRLSAARKILAYLKENSDPTPLASAARRLIFLKGRDSHDYKFSSAVLEDFRNMSLPWRDRYLAASIFYLKGTGDSDNDLVARTRAALSG